MMFRKVEKCNYELLCLLDGKFKNATSYGHYTTLELKKENNLSAEEIRNAYHQVSLKWNPDKIQQRERREPNKEEKNKWHEIEVAYQVLSNTEKRQKYDDYEGKNKYEKMIIDTENILGKENLKIEEKDWKPVYRKKSLVGEGIYILFYFNSEKAKAKQFQENILKSIPNQDLIKEYLLLNLTSEKRIKIKLLKKDVEQN